MDLARLREAFVSLRARQATLHGRTYSPFDEEISNVLYAAAVRALGDTAEPGGPSRLWVVSAPTGSGKSTASAAFAVAGLVTDPSFSATFVVETQRQANEVFELLAELTPPEHRGEVAVWTVAHDVATDPAKARADLGQDPAHRCRREDIPAARVVVVTHRKWRDEMERDTATGVRRWRGGRRSVVFIDEEPSLVRLVELNPDKVDRLRQCVERGDPDHPWLPVLERIVARMAAVFASVRGDAYSPVELVTREEVETLTNTSLVRGARRTIASGFAVEEARETHLNNVAAVLNFAKATCAGFTFFSGQAPRRFVAYQLQFTPSPGYVLLDATADIAGLRFLLPGMEPIEVPQVDYVNLRIAHVETPKEYRGRRIGEVTAKASSAREYAKWIKGTVLANTTAGERVLVVTHKEILTHEYLTEKPEEWAGRNVSVLHWGFGVGSNRWKDCGAVFLFGEFYIPRAQVVGTVLAHRGERLADATDLRHARGRELGGQFANVYRGHLLRWTKQLAARGAVRNIDAAGRCGTMRLFTSMPLARLAEFRATLFPGAPPVETLGGAGGEGERTAREGRPAELLRRLLATYPVGTVLWSDRIEAETGVRASDLSRALGKREVAPVVAEYGWSPVTAAEMRLPGKRRGLIRRAVATGPAVALAAAA